MVAAYASGKNGLLIIDLTAKAAIPAWTGATVCNISASLVAPARQNVVFDNGAAGMLLIEATGKVTLTSLSAGVANGSVVRATIPFHIAT